MKVNFKASKGATRLTNYAAFAWAHSSTRNDQRCLSQWRGRWEDRIAI